MHSSPQHLIEPSELKTIIESGADDYLIIDLCGEQSYQHGHIPGSVSVFPAELMDGRPPAPGKLPEKHRLDEMLSRIGFSRNKTVVVYDNEGGGWAGRMAWTLDVIGHDDWLYLNGGLTAWNADGYPLESATSPVAKTRCDVIISQKPIAEAEDIMARLNDSNLVVWDARSRAEYEGTKVVAQRGGHIPGAIHCEWTSLMNPEKGLRIREDAIEYLAGLGLTPDKSIVTHCQSHHRSGFTYLVARILQYPSIQAYHGSWSEWGNRPDTPIETTV